MLQKRYQSLCGALAPLCLYEHSRLDVAFATGFLCRAMSRPTPELYDDALRVLGYMCMDMCMHMYRTRETGLRYGPSTSPLSGMSDSDWAVKHSTTG